jgi:hypothetical protein
MSTSEPQPTEEELRAAYEAEIKRIRVEHVLLEQVVTLVNLGMRRTGIAPGTEDEVDPDQVRLAIEAIRAVLPILSQVAPEQVGPIRDAVSQLQMAYVKIGGAAPSPAAEPPAGGATPQPPPAGAEAPASEPPADPAEPGEPGPAQRSGRLWIPGQ